MLKFIIYLCYAVLIFIFAGNAFAVTPVLPSTVQPSVVGGTLSNQQTARRGRISAPTITEPTAPTKQMEEAKKITFKLKGINISGNTVYSDEQLKIFYQHDLGKTISVAELFTITQNITNFYRNNGYILSRAIMPPQEVTSGIVKIQVLEGFIANVTVGGNPHHAKCMVQRIGNHITESRPLQLKDMEKYLILANEIPGTTVKAQLSPSQALSKASDLVLVTENKRVTGYISYDNYGTLYIGPQQMTGNLAFNSFLFSGDSLAFTLTKAAKGGELTYNDLNYNAPWNDKGGRLTLGITRVTTHPLFVLRPLQIDGLNPNYYFTIYFPTIRTQTESLTWRLGFNYADTWSTLLYEMLYADHLRPIDLGGTWMFADKYKGSNMLSGDLRLGLPILGYTSDTNVATAQTSRPGGRGKFGKISLQASRTQALRGPVSLYATLQGQWGFVPLLTGEQFSFGGPVLGRGYDPGELLGDRGFGGTLELRYDKSAILSNQNVFGQVYVFYDYGMIWNIITAGGIPRKNSGTSAGIGLRYSIGPHITGNLMWTQVITKKIAAESLRGQGWNSRVFFSVQVSL